jgi:hypothetical protein
MSAARPGPGHPGSCPFRTLALLAVAVCGLTACAGGTASGGPGPVASTPLPAVSSSWREPARYSFALDSRCGEQPLIGRFAITVDNGVVTGVTGADDAASAALETMSRQAVPTLGDLLEQLAQARQRGAHVADVQFDPGDGHPTRVTIDQSAEAVDDELCYTVSDYRANG